MCDATFTFDQRGGHFFQCPSRRDHARLPKKLQGLLTSKQIAQVYHVALGFEDSFLITYRDKDGRDNIESQALPDELNDFLFATNSRNRSVRAIHRIRLTLGPYNTSFFVGDDSAYLWLNLPSRLLAALKSRIHNGAWVDRPRIVALGADQNFLLITEKHAAVWELSGYRTMSQMLEYSKNQENGIKEVQNIVLHSYRYQGFVAQSCNGAILCENLPQWSMQGIEGIKGPIMRDTREEEVRKRQLDLQRRPSLRGRDSNRRDLEHRATLRGQWNDKISDFERKANAKGLRLSLRLSISAGGVSFGKVLG